MSLPGGSHRRRAREHALQVLYQGDLGGEAEGAGDGFEAYWRHLSDESDPLVRSLAEELVRGVRRHRQRIDELIERCSKNWRIERMSRVDRNILRLATSELLDSDVPRSVVLNEAIEIAKRFGAEGSAAFVNGVLDRVADDIGR